MNDDVAVLSWSACGNVGLGSVVLDWHSGLRGQDRHTVRGGGVAEGHAGARWQSHVCSMASAGPRGCPGNLYIGHFLCGCFCPILTVMSALFCIFLLKELYFRDLNHMRAVKVCVWVCQQNVTGCTYHSCICFPGASLLLLSGASLLSLDLILNFLHFWKVGILIILWLTKSCLPVSQSWKLGLQNSRSVLKSWLKDMGPGCVK